MTDNVLFCFLFPLIYPDHGIVASFNVLKPLSLLEDNILQLENDILEEIGLPHTKVCTFTSFFITLPLFVHFDLIII